MTSWVVAGPIHPTRRALPPGQGSAQINLAVSTFVPKPFTPFQWEPMITPEETRRRQALITATLGGLAFCMALVMFFYRYWGIVPQGQQPAPGGDSAGEIALSLKVGERASLCPCPVSGLRCDDASLVKMVEDAAGQGLEGVKPGTTLCSLYGPNRFRRTYRVTVRAPQEDEKAPDRGREGPAPGEPGR